MHSLDRIHFAQPCPTVFRSCGPPHPVLFPGLNPAWQTQPVSWGSLRGKVLDITCSCRNHSASMAQETLFKLCSPDTALHDNILLPSVCSCLGRRPGLLSRASCTLLLGDKEGNTRSSSSWSGHRLFPRGVQVLVAGLSPCRGCPALTQLKEGGKALSRATLQPNTAHTWGEPGPQGVSGGPSVQCGLLSQ